MRPPPTWTTDKEIPKNARMWVPIRTATIRIPKEFTAILRASTARLSAERPAVSVRKIGILSGESMIGKSAPTIRSETRTNSEIVACMGTRASSDYLRSSGAVGDKSPSAVNHSLNYRERRIGGFCWQERHAPGPQSDPRYPPGPGTWQGRPRDSLLWGNRRRCFVSRSVECHDGNAVEAWDKRILLECRGVGLVLFEADRTGISKNGSGSFQSLSRAVRNQYKFIGLDIRLILNRALPVDALAHQTCDHG